jgi:hypothetical protein
LEEFGQDDGYIGEDFYSYDDVFKEEFDSDNEVDTENNGSGVPDDEEEVDLDHKHCCQ